MAESCRQKVMLEPLESDLIGVAIEVNIEDLPDDVASIISGAWGREDQVWHWADIPGLLCVISNYYDKDGVLTSSNGWSTIHGSVNFTLERFEREFLPFILARHNCRAVRVRSEVLSTDRFCADFDGKPVTVRWTWWRGSSPEEVRDLILAAQVMES